MFDIDDDDPGEMDLPGPVEALELEVYAARRALDRLTAALAAGTTGDERTTGKATWHRRQLAQFIADAAGIAEVAKRNPAAEAELAGDLAEIVHALTEDAETADGWAHYLTATAEARRTAAARKWAAALDAKTAETAKHLAHARRTLARALALDACHGTATAPMPRPASRRTAGRCQLARMVTTTGDDPLPARPQRCPTGCSVATAGLLTMKGQGIPTG